MKHEHAGRVAHTSRRFMSRCMRPLGSDRRHAKERHVCATRALNRQSAIDNRQSYSAGQSCSQILNS
jgi:hypothetical protein